MIRAHGIGQQLLAGLLALSQGWNIALYQFRRGPAAQGGVRDPGALDGRVHDGCVYEVVAEELAEAAAVAIADFVPRKARREAA